MMVWRQYRDTVSTSIRIVFGLLEPNAAKKFHYQNPHYLVEKYFGSVVIGGNDLDVDTIR
jgi:hypothetical protein